MAVHAATTLRNAMLDAITSAVGNAGKLQLWSGTVPGSAAATPGGTKLVEWPLGTPFAASSASGVLSPTIPSDVNALATGTATFYRLTTAGGTCVWQGDVVSSGDGIVLNPSDNSITSGLPVHIVGWAITAAGA